MKRRGRGKEGAIQREGEGEGNTSDNGEKIGLH